MPNGGQPGRNGPGGAEMPATGQLSDGTGEILPSTPVVVLLGGPGEARRSCRVEAPGRVLRMWSLLNAADEELHQIALPPEAAPRLQHLLEVVRTELARSVSPALADELGKLTNWPAGPQSLDELRVAGVSLLGWTSGLVMGMLGQLEAARLRQRLHPHREEADHSPAPPAANARLPTWAGLGSSGGYRSSPMMWQEQAWMGGGRDGCGRAG
jgi:Bacterial proteasome activator